MDSSSDGSFAWTDASDDTTDNETMAKTNMNTSQSGEESESGKTYKKKLQQRLFSGCTDDDGTKNSEAHRVRKRKITQHSDDEHIENSKKRRIKTEPESDVDLRKAKKKYKSSDTNSQELVNGSYDETYLDLKVKNEQTFAVPSPVKRKKCKSKSVSDPTAIEGDVSDAHKSPTSFEMKVRHPFTTQIQFEDESISLEVDNNKCDYNQDKRKKKKTKRKRHDSEDKDSIIRDSVEESVEQSIESNQNDQSPDDELDTNITISTNEQNKTQGEYKKASKDDVEKTPNANINGSLINDHSISHKNTNRKSRISERIRFEEDDSDVLTEKPETPIIKTNKKNTKLESFVKSNINWSPFCTKLTGASVLTDDDDVWVIRCPKDVKVEAFQSKQWTLDSKCKIKLDGQTYEGDVDNNTRNMTILSTKDENSILKKVTFNGCVRLRRRLPKTHILEGNIMINNQNNFIPLPETKCRHPLFGFNYKKAIKIPSAVAERLRSAHSSASSETRKKKKDGRKSGSNDQVSSTKLKMEPATESSAALEWSTATSKKKNKKQKHSTNAEPEAPQRHRRTKHDPESAEAWESEKAIEENLFNF